MAADGVDIPGGAAVGKGDADGAVLGVVFGLGLEVARGGVLHPLAVEVGGGGRDVPQSVIRHRW